MLINVILLSDVYSEMCFKWEIETGSLLDPLFSHATASLLDNK